MSCPQPAWSTGQASAQKAPTNGSVASLEAQAASRAAEDLARAYYGHNFQAERAGSGWNSCGNYTSYTYIVYVYIHVSSLAGFGCTCIIIK